MTSLISTRSDEPLAVEQTRAHDRRQWCWLLLLLGTGVVFVIPAYVARMLHAGHYQCFPLVLLSVPLPMQWDEAYRWKKSGTIR